MDELAGVMRSLVVAANQRPELTRVFSTFAADTPQVFLDLDRNKAQTLGVAIADVFNALQTTLGGYYVNDLNLFGRTWQVNIQADRDYRNAIDDILGIYVRNGAGEMVPMRSLASVRVVLGPSALSRYNLYRSVTINGAAAPASAPATPSRPWRASRPRTCRPATASSGPARRSRSWRRRARPASCSGSPCCSPTCSWWLSMRAGTSRSRCCSRSRSAFSARSARSCWSG